MRAAVYFSKGDLEKGSLLMDKFIHSLSDEELLDPMMNFALQIYYKTRSVSVKPISLKNMAHLCKLEQPSGVKRAMSLPISRPRCFCRKLYAELAISSRSSFSDGLGFFMNRLLLGLIFKIV